MRSTRLRAGAISFLALFTACGGDDPAGPEAPAAEVTALFEGEPFAVERAIVNRVPVQDRESDQVFVRATDDDLRTLNFQFPDEGPGTYTLGTDADLTVGVQIGAMFWDGNVRMGGGTLVVETTDDARISGTFTFTLIGPEPPSPFHVTEGRFDIEIRGVESAATPG